MDVIEIYVIGKIRDKNILSLIQEYEKRLRRVNIIHLKEVSGLIPQKTSEKEFEIFLPYLKKENYNIVLSEKGELFTSEKLAEKLSKIEGKIAIFISGPFGPSKKLLNLANQVLSLSPLTFTHEMALYLIVEQIYRVKSIQEGKAYHK